MFMEAPQTLLIMTVGAFVLGWIVAKVSGYFGNKLTARERDPERPDSAWVTGVARIWR